MWHCFFEQSGTFKNAFLQCGEQAPEKQEPAAMLPGMTSQIQPLPKDSI